MYRKCCMAPKNIKNHYEYVIIGGGIVGAGILRDLSLHKQDVLLIEKEDFSSQTSGGSSKMLHGGIRYLENFDFPLVFEALKEKNIWLDLASHISEERTFYLPVFQESKWPLFFTRIGLFIYDLLSLFKNSPYKVLNAKNTTKALPGIRQIGLKGSALYSDGVIDDSKLVFDLIFDSISRGSQALNYHELTSVQKENNNTYTLVIKNRKKNEEHKVSTSNLIFALGPFTDQVMHKLDIPWDDIILPSKGSHLWLSSDSLEIKDALVIQTKDGRVIFVIPQRNSILVGTTEVELSKDDNLANLKPSQEEIDYLLESVNSYFPSSNIDETHIIASYSAVRPLVRSGASASKTSRHHKIVEPMENLFVIAGGKYTTFRVMAQDICKKVLKNNNISYDSKLSLQPFKKKSIVFDINKQNISKELLQRIIKEELVFNKEDFLKRRLSLYSIEQAQNKSAISSALEDIYLEK